MGISLVTYNWERLDVHYVDVHYGNTAFLHCLLWWTNKKRAFLRYIYLQYLIISDSIYEEVTSMDWILYLVVGLIAATVIFTLIIVPALHFSKKPPAQLNNIHIGMSETDMLRILGKPKKIEQIDETTKMYLYEQVDKGGFLLWLYYKNFQILTKDSVVAHISYL